MKRGVIMLNTFPGTEIEVSEIKKGASKALFDGIFATGGITLSQVSVMTGLEPYVIQNWVKRGFVASPVKRVYGRAQFARIIIINMLKEALQLEKICELVKLIGGEVDNPDDDLIGDNVLYHIYVDLLSEGNINIMDESAVDAAVDKVLKEITGYDDGEKAKLKKILKVMLYSHGAARLKAESAACLATLY